MNELYDKLQILESDCHPLSRRERLKAMTGPLISWYEDHARPLPWRDQPEPYRVWVSEIMLQQTRVEAVKPYFQRFMEAFPDVKSLAEAEEEQLLKIWEGLGYYNRARNLQKAARAIMDSYEGRVPGSYEKLLALPGIGSYTAGAVASIAFGIKVPAVDGNVLRVVSRVLASEEDILKAPVKKKVEEDLREIMPGDRVSAFNQGLIEVGAMVCVPNGPPRCHQCPLASLCLARRSGSWDSIPFKSPKKPRKTEKRTILLLESDNHQIAIEKRPDTGLLASLYQFPNLEGSLNEIQLCSFLEGLGAEIRYLESAGSARHIFSHVEWNMTGYHVFLKGDIPAQYLSVDIRQLLTKYPLPNAFGAYLKLLVKES